MVAIATALRCLAYLIAETPCILVMGLEEIKLVQIQRCCASFWQ